MYSCTFSVTALTAVGAAGMLEALKRRRHSPPLSSDPSLECVALSPA